MTESGGYIWHTTRSGKTLTSFKAAQLATELDFIDKVFFVADRKDLDYQTMKEFSFLMRRIAHSLAKRCRRHTIGQAKDQSELSR